MDRQQLTWLFFGFSGRINRMAFFLAGLLMAVVQLFLLYRFTIAPEHSIEGQRWAVAFWVAVLISFWPQAALAVKRLHDFGKPGLFAVTLFIPVLLVIAFFVLCLYPGDKGDNAYGPRPGA